jgi:hypothetical protein
MQLWVLRMIVFSSTPDLHFFGMTPPAPLSQFLAFSSMPDLHFLGVADDRGIVLGNASSSP